MNPSSLAASGVFVLMMHDMELQRWEGGILALGILIYIISSIKLAKQDRHIQKKFAEFKKEAIQHSKEGGSRVFLDLGLILLGIAALVLGADWLVKHGEFLALHFGVPKVIISLTLFALGTSLPELATTIVASLKKQGDIITGNAIAYSVIVIVGQR